MIEVLILISILLISYGVYLISIPCGFIALGVLLFALCVLAHFARMKDPKRRG